MSQDSLTDAAHTLRPVASNERIQALDVVRGFALIGIFLMNIEWFNRPIAELGSGLPSSAQGADWWAGYLIYILVQGKFWTMFSLLFGMGFAVMLTRAERAERSFLVPYMRRIAALAVFGACHHIFLWAGDILFSYAVGATLLLALLWARRWAILAVLVACIAAVFMGVNWAFPVGMGVSAALLGSIFLHSESHVGDLPRLSLVFFLIGGVLAAFAALAGVLPMVPPQMRWPLLVGAAFLLLLGYLSARYKDPVEKRPRRLGVTMYLVPLCVWLSMSVLQVYGPQRPTPTEAQVAAATAQIKAEKAAGKTDKPDAAPAKDASAAKAKKSPTEEAADREAQRRIDAADQVEQVATERRLMTTGSYIDMVRMRAGEFVEHMPGEFAFSLLIIGMFMLGYWFVRTGIMEHPAEHLPLFGKMAALGIPLGVGLGILSSAIAIHEAPGMHGDKYQIAMAMMMIGNLPACLGYVGLIVTLLHGRSPLRRINVLAPLGRMALTNYLTHSLVCSLYFYGYAGGNYGMGRATQVGFVFTVIALQVVFSHLWLSKFRFGPMEWLWRAITYWQVPPLLRERGPELDAGRAAA